ncbi:MAG: putative toxin-antitoxin system toxin component, PIN family [Dehalococcoidia bacterium CG2_30_46_19]|nr:MAG: putative toxin-antitoxin system toxin component, PIN family [Dehalococcoidia bacterium CG2_30_46_19]
MLKIVLDTNVFVSALINPRGKPAQILNYVFESKVRLFTSPSIIEELERVLSYPKLVKRHGLEKQELKKFVSDLLSILSLVEGKKAIEVIAEDPADNNYLSCVVDAKADFIVSGDIHLLNLREYEGIQIITPAQFLEMLEKEKP